ncbi:hypothetical protein CRYUN_Cryun39dG0062800 [Craigia yunnanensis]
MLTTSVTAPSLPLLSPGSQSKSQIRCSGCCGVVRISKRIKPIGLGLQLQPIVGRSRKQSVSVICAAAALNATCSASGQTQTITREAPTITQAPVHGWCVEEHVHTGEEGSNGDDHARKKRSVGEESHMCGPIARSSWACWNWSLDHRAVLVVSMLVSGKEAAWVTAHRAAGLCGGARLAVVCRVLKKNSWANDNTERTTRAFGRTELGEACVVQS